MMLFRSGAAFIASRSARREVGTRIMGGTWNSGSEVTVIVVLHRYVVLNRTRSSRRASSWSYAMAYCCACVLCMDVSSMLQ
jgi:hypothetical protein